MEASSRGEEDFVGGRRGPFLTSHDLASAMHRTIRGKSLTLGGVGVGSGHRLGAPPPVRYVQALLAEFIGTFFLSMAYGLNRQPDTGMTGTNMASLAIGAAVAAITFGLFHVSGAHFNPVVSLGAVLSRQMSATRGSMYVLLQMLGALTGSFVAVSMSYSDATANLPYHPSPMHTEHHTVLSSIVVEALFCANLTVVAVIMADKHVDEPNSYYGIAVGGAYIAGMSACMNISGGSLNPAVATALSFASLAVGGNMHYVWVYWLAGVLGACAGAAVVFGLQGSTRAERSLPHQALVAECFGTFVLTLTAALGGGPIGLGFVLLALIHTLDQISGAEVNPAVTFGLALRFNARQSTHGRIALVMAIQVLGAVAAGFVALFITGTVSYPHPDGAHGTPGALFYELLWTAFLDLTVFLTATPVYSDDENPNKGGRSLAYHGVAISFVLLCGVWFGGSTGGGSGGVFNPALGLGISLASAASSGTARHVWVYLVAPMVGAALGAYTFRMLHYHKDPSPGGPASLALSTQSPFTWTPLGGPPTSQGSTASLGSQ